MTVQRKALGRGLGALLPVDDLKDIQPVSETQEVLGNGPVSSFEIPVSEIEPNPYQPRTVFDPEALEELAGSIRNIGIIQPLTLRKTAMHRYQIISGERRFRAAVIAGLTKVPAYIRTTDDMGMLEMAIVENIQRKDLDPIETALSFRRLMEECNLTQEDMADRVGKKRASVANALRLLKLPVEVQKALRMGRISVGHAKALLALDDERKQIDFCWKTIEGDWSVRILEERISKSKSDINLDIDDGKRDLPDEYYRFLEVIGKYFENKISLKKMPAGGGRMTIRFKSDKELANFLQVLEDSKI